MTKYKQYIRVLGHPEKLLTNFDKTATTKTIKIYGKAGSVLCTSQQVFEYIINLLNDKAADYNIETRKLKHARPLGGSGRGGRGAVKGCRGKIQAKDIIYTIESESERDLLDKTDAVINQLNAMGIEYEEVCKWFCMKEPIKHKVERSQAKPRFNKVLNRE